MLKNSKQSQLGTLKNYLVEALGNPYGNTVVGSLQNLQVDYISSGFRRLTEDLSVKVAASGSDLIMA